MTGTAFSVRAAGGIAWLTLDLPDEPVNKITRGVRSELDSALNRLAVDDTVRAVVLISGKADGFIAGADIDEFVALGSRDQALALVREGQALVNRLARFGKPTVVAIHGACLGGGLEAALACAYRIATDHPKTKIGLPEVQLGILPAAGGCQRLPRLIGLRGALDMILAGKQLAAKRALRLGLVDELVHPSILQDVAEQAADRLADGWKPKRRRFGLADLVLDRNPLGRRVVFSQARKQVARRTGGHYPAPVAAIATIEHGLRHGVEAGLDMEAAQFAELATSDVSRQLVRIFFATTALRKERGVDREAPPPHHVSHVGVVGAGFMGAGIGGVAAARAHVDVRLKDTDLKAVGRGLKNARRVLKDGLRRHRITRYEFYRLDRLLSGGTDWHGFGLADVVVEAVFEDLGTKHEVMRDIERHVRPDCVIASNTSTIPIATIAEVLERPERVLGMHFFSPVDKMPLLEVIVTTRTSPRVIMTAVELGKRMGKTVVVVQDRPGFWVNRILAPYLNEAGRLLQEGESVEAVDRAMVKFGFPVGPITLIDEVGLDVAQKASAILHQAFGERMEPMDGLTRMVEDGRLGRKSGRGFYRYEHGKRREVSQAAYEIIGAVADSSVDREDVTARLVFAMLNEAARAIDEGVVSLPRDGDIAAIFGIGFPPFRGGPLRYLDELGAAYAVTTLQRLAERYGDRFTPCPLLQRLETEGGRFYPRD